MGTYVGWGESTRTLVPWRGKGLGIQQGTSVWVGLSESTYGGAGLHVSRVLSPSSLEVDPCDIGRWEHGS